MHWLPKMKKKHELRGTFSCLCRCHRAIFMFMLYSWSFCWSYYYFCFYYCCRSYSCAQSLRNVSCLYLNELYRILCAVVCLFFPDANIDELNAKEIQFKRIFFILSHIMAFFVVSCFCVYCNENKYVCVFVLLLECNSISLSRKWTDK